MPVSVFFSYSHKDEALRDQIETQLTLLKRQGIIETWHDRRIGAGEPFAAAIDAHVEHDDIILLLVSADFVASEYCYNVEMQRAMQRHEAGEAIVIPVILRACDWHDAPFGKLNAIPRDGKPVTQFADRDEALLEVAKAVRAAASRLGAKAPGPGDKQIRPAALAGPSRRVAGPRSSNLALAKTFSDRDRDVFKRESFDYISRFFENSLAELQARNDGIETAFRLIDANRFTAAVYKHGRAAAKGAVFLGDRVVGQGIAFSSSDSGNGFNELLTVEVDDQSMFLRSLGMAAVGGGRERAKLSQEGAAELFWAILIEPLQPGR